MVKGYIKIVFVIYLILGLYLLNFALGIIGMPNFIVSNESWVFLISGILLIFGGFGFLRKYKHVV